MKITDTCRCGASFSVSDDKNYGESQKQHKEWLDAHEKCRDSQTIVTLRSFTPTPPMPLIPKQNVIGVFENQCLCDSLEKVHY